MDCWTDLLLTNVAGCCSKLQALVLNIGVGTGGAPGACAPPSFQSVPCPLYMSCTTNLIYYILCPPQSKSLSYTSADYYKPELIMNDAWFQLQGLITYANMQERM